VPPERLIVGPVTRYSTRNEIITPLDPIQALTTQIQFLTAVDYAQELLSARHHAPSPGSKKRAQRIAAHVRIACAYVDQARNGPPEVSFVPSYYAILNLIKVCILLGPSFQGLDANRWHGAHYDVAKKDSRGLTTEQVVIHPRGAIALYYETLSGRRLQKRRVLAIGDIYPFIGGVASEWEVATGRPLGTCALRFRVLEANRRKHLRIEVLRPRGRRDVKRNELPVVRTCSAVKGISNVFDSRTRFPDKVSDVELLRASLNPLWLYHPVAGLTIAPLYAGRLALFEELPLVVAFFHLSSVARYKPEFMEKLRESRFWPVVACMPADGLLRFLLLFWSYARQECIELKGF